MKKYEYFTNHVVMPLKSKGDVDILAFLNNSEHIDMMSYMGRNG